MATPIVLRFLKVSILGYKVRSDGNHNRWIPNVAVSSVPYLKIVR